MFFGTCIEKSGAHGGVYLPLSYLIPMVGESTFMPEPLCFVTMTLQSHLKSGATSMSSYAIFSFLQITSLVGTAFGLYLPFSQVESFS